MANLDLALLRLGTACDARTACTLPAIGGACYREQPAGRQFCGVPCTDGHTSVGPGTTCSQTSRFPGQRMDAALCDPAGAP